MDKGVLFGRVDKQFPVDRQGGSYPQAFAGAIVDLIGNGVELLLTVDRQVVPLWQVLANETIGVFVASSLPHPSTIPVTYRLAPHSLKQRQFLSIVCAVLLLKDTPNRLKLLIKCLSDPHDRCG